MVETRSSLPVGERVGDYQILGIVGAGGMGVVYKALDLKLERTVALKFLSQDMNIGEKEKERFLREAKAASALDHTNIGVIHGLEETPDGQLFIVMAYYEGKTLAQRMREGPFPVDEAVGIAIQMARGLSEAHGRNIVHRDIKPSNLILTSQNVLKIVDFGLAFVVSTTTATQSLGIAGTVAYMSPEQAMGKLLDQRSDIWSAGVVLAEMFTGRHPFQRDNLSSVVLAIMHEPPLQLDGVPVELQKTVYRALAKDPANRYQSAQEMLADLQRLKVDDTALTLTARPEEMGAYVKHASSPSGAAAPARKPGRRWMVAAASVIVLLLLVLLLVPSTRQRIADVLSAGNEKHIAVLPFDNIGNNPANEPLAQGLMDSLTSRLSNLDVGQQSLWVVPATEVRRRKVVDPTAALRELGATLVVKGSIVRDGKDVRLTVNLINAKTLRQIGSAEFQDRAGDFSTLQDEAVSRLAQLMHIAVTPDMLRNTGGVVVPVAYESYLKALGYIQRYDKPGNLDLAIQELTSAVQTDPRFALGYAGLGQAYQLKYLVDPNPHWIDEASANCKRAAGLNDRLPIVYVTLGRIHDDTGKYDLAVQEFQHALQLNPRDADALNGMANAYEKAGRVADAEATFKRAAALRSDYWDGYNALGLFYDRQGRYPDSIAQLQHAIELTPDNAQAYFNLGAVYIDTGDSKEFPAAEQALKKSIELSPSYPAYANLGYLYLQEKRYAESAAATEKALQLNDKNFAVWQNLANAYSWLNEKDKAAAAHEKELELLEQTARVKPRDAQILSTLALRYAKKKQRDKAMIRLQEALALSPNDPGVLMNAGEVYEDLGERGKALDYVGRGLQKGYPLNTLKNNPDLQKLLSDPNFRPASK